MIHIFLLFGGWGGGVPGCWGLKLSKKSKIVNSYYVLGTGLVAGIPARGKPTDFCLFRVLHLECSSSRSVGPRPQLHENHLESLFKSRPLRPNLSVSDSGGLDWALRSCISDRFPGDADTADLGHCCPETAGSLPFCC